MTQLALPLLVLASKIQPATIRLESEASAGVVVVSTFKEANAQMAVWVPRGTRGYCKCWFTITYADGEIYQGKMDLTRGCTPSLGMHVLTFQQAVAGLCKPVHMTAESYASLVATFEARNPGGIEAAKDFLARYSLGL